MQAGNTSKTPNLNSLNTNQNFSNLTNQSNANKNLASTTNSLNNQSTVKKGIIISPDGNPILNLKDSNFFNSNSKLKVEYQMYHRICY